MIGRLRGIVSTNSPDGELIIDVNGVGYELRIPAGSLGRLAIESDGSQTIHVHTAYKQDGVDLYGFASVEDRAVFRALIAVPNLGPKTAIAVLGTLTISDLVTAIESGDIGRLSKVSGVGKKTAERMVVELKGKLTSAKQGIPLALVSPKKSAKADRLVTALTNMGYRPAEAGRAVESLGDRVDTLELAEALRDALAQLARK